jgi:antitoxin component YwqK of YwqJK toxin-antitoxin module
MDINIITVLTALCVIFFFALCFAGIAQSFKKDPYEEREYWDNGKIKMLIRHHKSTNMKEIFNYLETGVGEEIIVRKGHQGNLAWGSEDSYSCMKNGKMERLITYYETGERKTLTLFKNGKIDEMIKFNKAGDIEGSHEPNN